MPGYSKFLIDRFSTIDQLDKFVPVELCNLKYDNSRAACIEPHLDDSWLWGNRLLTINLLANTFLTLTPTETIDLKYNNYKILIPLKQRSLLILSNEARYEWLHEIKKVHIRKIRLAINIRELSSEFLNSNTDQGKLGEAIQKIALSYQG